MYLLSTGASNYFHCLIAIVVFGICSIGFCFDMFTPYPWEFHPVNDLWLEIVPKLKCGWHRNYHIPAGLTRFHSFCTSTGRQMGGIYVSGRSGSSRINHESVHQRDKMDFGIGGRVKHNGTWKRREMHLKGKYCI